MTKEELAKQYHEKIIERNPQAEAYDFQSAFLAGFEAARFKDGSTNGGDPNDDDLMPDTALYMKLNEMENDY